MADIDPLDLVDEEEDEDEARDAGQDAGQEAAAATVLARDSAEREARSRLNTRVAITVALLATFTGVCKVKDDNIVQAMQQAQSDRVDDWNYYQAKNVREEVARASADQLRMQSAVRPGDAALARMVVRYDSIAANESRKKEDVRKKAEGDQTTYDALNYRDDQFDLSDTLAAIAISLLAVTSLTHKRWLWWASLVPTALAVLMGLAGLLGWHIHSDTIARLLS
jgi:hypothetical protein